MAPIDFRTFAMSQQIDRRRAERRTEAEELSPEYLALLEVCGGEMRASDRALLAQRRRAVEGTDAVREAKMADSAESVQLHADRRAAKL